VVADEVARRHARSSHVRAKAAHLDPSMVAEAWDDSAAVTFDHALWHELTTLRFVDNNHNALILGPVGVGKTFLATALGHIGCRRRYRVHFERADKLFKRMKVARLDNSVDAETRKLVAVDLLVIDDFALHPLDVTDTNLFYELVVERHRQGATILTSNRDPSEFLAQFADPLLAQSAVDRIQSAAYELVIEGESYRKRQRPQMASPLTDSGSSKGGR
jgi:DNA replication protein DnaC